ncbi:MAG: hypothetical protein OEY37_07565 [Gammaproteobacteria bacterium]|nr:hypothetical protein [Gammaproteobacteria bacterium]MDH5617069.1 hypothetical protein [Gammaproteobacteria bacterium]
MMNCKIAVALTLLGLFAANVAFAVPGFTSDAPQSSIDTCVAEVASHADFSDAANVVYNVQTEDRRVSGHKLRIQTLVYGADGDTVIREYAAACAVNDQSRIKRFQIRQKNK